MMNLSLKRVRAWKVPVSKWYQTGAFVSEHFVPPVEEFKSVLKALDTPTRPGGTPGTTVLKVCRLCSKENKDVMSNHWKLTIRENGSYYCFRCSHGGSYLDLKKKAAGGQDIQLMSAKKFLTNEDGVSGIKKPLVSLVIPTTLGLFNLKKESPHLQNAAIVLEFLNKVRGINSGVLVRYGVGMAVEKFMSDSGTWEDQLCVTFPWMKAKESDQHVELNEEPPMETIRIKYRALKTKGLQRVLPKGGQWGFFGWHTVRPHHEAVIITEGEYDAMAVAQGLDISGRKGVKAGRKVKSGPKLAAINTTEDENEKEGGLLAVSTAWDIPVISLPNGCNSLPIDLIPLLDRFTTVYLWLDNDKSGQDSATKFAYKLGLKRCYIVKPNALMENPPKDANDALRQDPHLIKEMISEAEVLSHERIQRFSDYRSLVIAAVKKKDLTDGGTPTPSIPKLVKICKGFRGGELVVFTGPTGAGKTTLLSQLSLDFAKEGVPTLWASFEILNCKLMEKMLRQSYRKGDISMLDSKALDTAADEFAALPLYFLNFYGSSDLDQIVEAMEYAVYRDDVKHIILDNLQFMLPRSVNSGNFDKFTMQDAVIERFRRFATEKLVNIILVVHPRKEDEDAYLNLASVFGTAKATQEADLVLILQGRKGVYTSLDIKKNRFDGTLGRIFLQYSHPLHSFVEANEDEAMKELSEAPVKYSRRKV